MATDYSTENPHRQLAKLQAEQPHVQRLAEAATMWQTAQQRIREARDELFMRTKELVETSWRDDAGQAFQARVEESIRSLSEWHNKIDDSGVIGQVNTLQLDFPNCLAQVRALCDQFDAAVREAQAQSSGGTCTPDPAYLERAYAKLAAQYTNHLADRFDAVTRAMDLLAGVGPGWAGPREEEPGDQGDGELVERILANARGEVGTRESPPGSNQNPYGYATEWCSLFATKMWERAGVDISDLDNPAFTGNVYTWGEQNGHAYDANNLDQARPGDVLLFGTGPESPDTSTHIGIVESVNPDGTVTLIEGNSGANIDAVVRDTHTLSPDNFYGGVHP